MLGRHLHIIELIVHGFQNPCLRDTDFVLDLFEQGIVHERVEGVLFGDLCYSFMIFTADSSQLHPRGHINKLAP